MLDAPRRRHWTLSFLRDHAIASCPKEQPSLSATAQTSLSLSEYFLVSSSTGFSFHPYSWVKEPRRLCKQKWCFCKFKLNNRWLFWKMCWRWEEGLPLCTTIESRLLSNWTRNIYSKRADNKQNKHKMCKLHQSLFF